MKPHARIRKTIKWGGAVGTLLLALAWAASGWWWVSLLPTPRHWVAAGAGKVSLCDDPVMVPLMALLPKVMRHDPTAPHLFQWWLSVRGTPIGHSSIGIASIDTPTRTLTILLWPLMLLTAGATGVAWRLDAVARRRQRAHVCPNCNYDRTGLAPSVLCPECGGASALGS